MLYENRYKGICVYRCAHLSILGTYFVHPYCISPFVFLSHTCVNGVQVKHQWRMANSGDTKWTLGVVWPWVILQMSAVLCARGQHSPFLFLLPPPSPPFLSPSLFSTRTRLPLRTIYEDHLRSHQKTQDESVSLISPCTEVDVTLFLA